MRVKDLASIAFGHRKHGIIMVIRVYLDGSGDETDPVQTVAGYLASDSVCAAIEDDWLTALNGKGPFHLADLGTPYCKLGSSTWSINDRVAFLKRLGGIVNRRGNNIIGFSVERSLYRSYLLESPHAAVYGPPYSACAQLCFSLIELQLARAGYQQEEVAYVIEKGDREEELRTSFNEYDRMNPQCGKRSLSSLPKGTILLQPTDLIAGKVQGVLVRARGALGFLDNGQGLTPIQNFRRYYSYDGTSEALLQGEAKTRCFVANPSLFAHNDPALSTLFQNNPSLLQRREKKRRNQGKRKHKRPNGTAIALAVA